MNRRVCGLVAGVAFGLMAQTVLSQQVVAHEAKPETAIRLDVVVTDRSGKAVGGLAKERFSLLDNGVSREISVHEVVRQADAASVLIVVDAVNTPYTALAYQREQIQNYLRAKDGQLAHKTSLAILTDQGVKLSNQPTQDGNALASEFQHAEIGLRVIGRDQGFYGAQDRLTISLNALRDIAAHEKALPGRKLVVWVSPGWPLLSGPNIQLDNKQQDQIYGDIVAYSTLLREARITLYSVNSWGAAEGVGRATAYESYVGGVSKPGKTDLGDLGLQVLAAQSGGRVLNTSDVVGMIGQSVADSDDFYEVSFEPVPAEKPMEYHRIQVQVDGLTARTRQSYYTSAQR